MNAGEPPDDALTEGTSRARGVLSLFVWLVGLAVAVAIFLLMATTLMYQVVYANRIFLGVRTADGVQLGALTPEDAHTLLGERLRARPQVEIQVRYRERQWLVQPEALGLQFDVNQVVRQAYAVGREGSTLERLRDQLDAFRFGRVIAIQEPTVSAQARQSYLAARAKEIDRPAIDSRLVMGADLKPVVSPSQAGRRLRVEEASRLLEQAVLAHSAGPIDLPVQETPPVVTEADLEPTRSLAAKLLSAPLTAKYNDQSWTLERSDIAAMVVFRDVATAGGKKLPTVDLDEAKLAKFVERLAREIDRKPRKPRLDFAGGQLKVLQAGGQGRQLDTKAALAALKAQVASDDRTVHLPVAAVDAPAMGADRGAIKELIMQATTPYAGGSAERRYNIELAAKKLHGVVVGPDEIFSFNEEMGPMTLEAGFKWGWAITQEGGKHQTVPSVAGGICQVSTTLFQATFWAGYQLEERSWHLYWISRYGTPPTGMKGLDATVDQVYDDNGKLSYTVDFKFKNNTPNPILIQTKTDGNNLTFAIYGTKPGWEVKIDQPIIEDVVPPDPKPVREVDPMLAPGQEIAVETAMEGFKSTIVRMVLEEDREPRVLKLVSKYQPSGNVFRVGPPATTAPAPSAPASPQATAAASPTAAPRPGATPTPNPRPRGR